MKGTAISCNGTWYMYSVLLLLHNNATVLPLYLYQDDSQLTLDDAPKRTPNFDLKIIEEIAQKIRLRFVPDHELPEATEADTFTPLDVLDYIYAVLHSPKYRDKYKEFLKIDFPRVPYPDDVDAFRQLVALGQQIRQIHLLESPLLNTSNIRLDGGTDLNIQMAVVPEK